MLKFRARLLSHRGGAAEFIENSMPAFRYSASIGVDVLELDCQLTKDNQVVIFHDRYLSRMCGNEYKSSTISQFNYSDLPLLKQTLAIPKLEDLLQEFPKYPMQIDVKNASPELVCMVGLLIQKYERQSVTVWGSFLSTPNQLCYRFDPTIPLFGSFKRIVWLRLLWMLGLMHFIKIHESALIIPYVSFLLNPGWFRALKSHGISIIVFGAQLNCEERWNHVYELGAGVCTDHPTRAMEWLSKRD